MRTEFTKSFLSDVKKVRNDKLRSTIADVIEHVESVESIFQIHNLRKLEGFELYYRIRLGDYRIGLKIENKTVSFSTFDHRKNIYKNFP